MTDPSGCALSPTWRHWSSRPTAPDVLWKPAAGRPGHVVTGGHVSIRPAYLQRLLRYAPLARGLCACARRREPALGEPLRPAPGAHCTRCGSLCLPGPAPGPEALHGIAVRSRGIARVALRAPSAHPLHLRHLPAWQGRCKALLVFEDRTLDGTCTIYDLLAQIRAGPARMLALFILRSAALGRLHDLAYGPGRRASRRVPACGEPDSSRALTRRYFRCIPRAATPKGCSGASARVIRTPDGSRCRATTSARAAGPHGAPVAGRGVACERSTRNELT